MALRIEIFGLDKNEKQKLLRIDDKIKVCLITQKVRFANIYFQMQQHSSH